ncbi:major head protein [Gordonia phage Nordenberg]|uniref:Major capsid hexamer protein n=1 Tax=Gordonia phage Nordenberg TaxID=2483672 RepID=A0A3G3M9J0_9CAUD|nr:major head protein [Gordonia phage Nordenberg]AYR03079.1 major capsid hexamer protein [Gordonia phage Nordenberg]
MKVTLESLIEAAQATDANGNTLSAADRQSKISELLQDADRGDVDAILNESIEKYRDLDATDPQDDAELFGLELLVDTMTAARGMQTKFAEADAAKQQQRAELAARVNELTAESEPAGENGEQPGEQTTGEETTGDPTVTEGETTEGGDPTTTEQDPDNGGSDQSAETTEGAEMVAASGKRSHFSVGAVAARKATGDVRSPDNPAEQAPTGVVITASSGVRGHNTGQQLDGIPALARAAAASVRGLPTKGVRAMAKADIASLAIQFPDELVASADRDLAPILRNAVDESRLPGESITAAGGWCAPSETLYEIPGSLTDANAGLINLPEVQVHRGGLRFRRQIDFGTIYAGGMAGRVMTEAMSESEDPADYTKAFYRVDCPDFVEERADAVYTGASAGILQNHAYPEEVEAQIAELIAAHSHRINEISLERMEAIFAGAGHNQVNFTNTFGPSTVGASLNAIEWVITNERTRLRASESLRFKVAIPQWYKTVFRADYANRTGVDDALSVSDGQIEQWFNQRGASVDWTYDWQDALSLGAAGVGGATTANQLPTSVKVMVWPEGTIVRGRGDIINMEAIYDSAGLETNDFLRLFMEEQLVVLWRAYRGSLLTLPLSASGATGAARDLDGNGKIIVAAP